MTPWYRNRTPQLCLDFGQQGESNRHAVAPWASFMLASLMTGLAADHYARSLELERSARDRLELVTARTAPARRAPAARADARQAAESLGIRAQLTYPWVRFFETLEAGQHPDIALLTVEPERRTGLTRITAEAKDAHAMFAFLGELQHSPAFESVVLTSHEIQSKRPGSPLRFDLQGRWRMEAAADALAAPRQLPAPLTQAQAAPLQASSAPVKADLVAAMGAGPSADFTGPLCTVTAPR